MGNALYQVLYVGRGMVRHFIGSALVVVAFMTPDDFVGPVRVRVCSTHFARWALLGVVKISHYS